MAREHYWPTGSKTAQDQEKRALAAEHDRQVRHRSVANDLRLDLPVSVARPDGEEYPARTRLRSHDKRYEIQKPYIQGPPNKTVWDSIDCLERTVTQPSSSSSRSGGSKSTSKSSSSHWGLSWSRSNKSPPSQGRSSRGQQRHPHASNPSTSVRNAPNSSSCETARCSNGGGGAGGGLLASPSLLSSMVPLASASSPGSLGAFPNSSPLGFHGAATSLVAGDTVHCAFPNHNHHHPSSSEHPPSTSTSKQHHQPLVFSGGGASGGSPGPSIAERLSEKVQHCTNALVGNHNSNTRTSPNNIASNSSSVASASSSSSTSVLSRLIDPDSKLFSRSGSKDSKRSNNNNGKNGKSHRTDQSSSASSSPGCSSSSLVAMVDCSSTGADVTEHQRHQQHPHSLQYHEQLQQHHFHHTSQGHPAFPVPTSADVSSRDRSAGGPSAIQPSSRVLPGSLLDGHSFFASFDDSGCGEGEEVGVGATLKRSNINVMMPLRSKTPDNNNPSCSSTSILSGGSRSSSRTGPSSSSSSSGVPVRMMTTDAYCGADAGAIHTNSSDNKGVAVVGYPSTSRVTSDLPLQQQQLRSNVCVPMTQQQGHGSVFSDCENGNNARVPVVGGAASAAGSLVRSRSQHCGIVDSDTNNTLKLSQSSSSWTKGEMDDALVVRDEGMKQRVVPMALGQHHRQQQQQHHHYHQTIFANAHTTRSPDVSFKSSQQHNVQMSSSVPATLSSSTPLFNCSFQNAAALLPRDVPPTIRPAAATTTASVAAAEPSSLSCCSVKEKKRSDYETCTFSSSGCSTDPNYSNFAKINHNHNNNNCCTPHQPTPSSLNSSSSSCSSSNVQSQYLDIVGSSNDLKRCNNNSSMDTTLNSSSNVLMEHNNENNNFSLAQNVNEDVVMISESSSSMAVDTGDVNMPPSVNTSSGTALSPSAGESMMVGAPSSPVTSSSSSSATPLTTPSPTLLLSSSSSATAPTTPSTVGITATRPDGSGIENNNHRDNTSFVTTCSLATIAASNVSDTSNDKTTVIGCTSSNNSNTANTATTSVRETAHHCELSETIIASKNDTDQYCTAAATAELITTSLHSSPNSNSPSSTSSSSSASSMETSSSSSQALSLLHQQPTISSSPSVASRHHHQFADKSDYDMHNNV